MKESEDLFHSTKEETINNDITDADSDNILSEERTDTTIAAKSNIQNDKIIEIFDECGIKLDKKDESHEIVQNDNNKFQKMALQERHKFLSRMQRYSFKSKNIRRRESNRSKIVIKNESIADKSLPEFAKIEKASSPLLLETLNPENVLTTLEVHDFFQLSFFILFSFFLFHAHFFCRIFYLLVNFILILF